MCYGLIEQRGHWLQVPPAPDPPVLYAVCIPCTFLQLSNMSNAVAQHLVCISDVTLKRGVAEMARSWVVIYPIYWLTPLARKPPSTTRVSPVTKDAASDER